MTPKEKAKQLVEKYQKSIWESGNTVSKPMVKQCALIAVDEIINNQMSLKVFYDNMEIVNNVNYWQKVKTEIEKL